MNYPFDPALERPAADPALWPLDRAITFLNHGSFGSCPIAVLQHQQEWRNRLERQPVRFYVRELEQLWDDARAAVAAFVGAAAEDLVFVPNATAGINTVLRSLRFQPSDELLVTDHEYNACRNALDYVAQSSGATVVVARIPFPLRNADEAVDAIASHVTSRTRLALVDHVTSQTGLVLPIARIVQALARHGVDVLVDGAHAPGMVDLDLGGMAPAYYTGNCHKWMCAPKSVAFLHIRRDRQAPIRPLVISHGANSPRSDRSRFLIEFGWMGTGDLSPALSAPEAIRFLGTILPGGWNAVREHNRQLSIAGRRIAAEVLDVNLPSNAFAPLPRPASGSVARELRNRTPHHSLTGTVQTADPHFRTTLQRLASLPSTGRRASSHGSSRVTNGQWTNVRAWS